MLSYSCMHIKYSIPVNGYLKWLDDYIYIFLFQLLYEFFCMKDKENPDKVRGEIVDKMEWLLKNFAKEAKLSTEACIILSIF